MPRRWCRGITYLLRESIFLKARLCFIGRGVIRKIILNVCQLPFILKKERDSGRHSSKNHLGGCYFNIPKIVLVACLSK